jgi:hypothetical protein
MATTSPSAMQHKKVVSQFRAFRHKSKMTKVIHKKPSLYIYIEKREGGFVIMSCSMGSLSFLYIRGYLVSLRVSRSVRNDESLYVFVFVNKKRLTFVMGVL